MKLVFPLTEGQSQRVQNISVTLNSKTDTGTRPRENTRYLRQVTKRHRLSTKVAIRA